MPHRPRQISPGFPYHITCRGNNRAAIFHSDEDRAAFLSIIALYKKRTPFLLYHYCLMDNHIHLSLNPVGRSRLADVMQRICHAYSRYHKKKYSRVGHLWQSRFHSKVIEDDAYLLTSGIYIELNPVRAGLVTKAEDYAWSSHKQYVNGTTGIVDTSPVFLSLGTNLSERVAAYRALTRMWLHMKAEGVPPSRLTVAATGW